RQHRNNLASSVLCVA
ncbi:hypothetical protein CISIN_1g0447652mg, partial [Citrus sinensis]